MRPGAIVVSGGLDALDLQHFGDAPLLIDGQNSAAIAVTIQPVRARRMAQR